MKAKKAICMLVSILLMMVSLAPFACTAGAVKAAENLTYQDWEYQVLDDGTVKIAKYKGSAKEVVIPEEIDGQNVTCIGDRAFYYCSSLTSIEIPEGVTSIGDSAFYGCSSLTRIEIPSGVTSIGNDAFYGCSSLTRIEIPESVTRIGGSAFFNCNNLTSIEIPSGVTSIQGFTFWRCSSLKSIEIPESVTSINQYAFANCSSLIHIEIPGSVTSISEYAFSDHASRFTIYGEEGSFAQAYATEKNIKFVAGVTFEEGKTEEYNYIRFSDGSLYITKYIGSAEEVIIPSAIEGKTVTGIEDSAFEYCTGLTSIKIPSSVTSIGVCAFWHCSSLTRIEIPESVTSIGNNAFYDCAPKLTIYGEEGSFAQAYATEKNKNFVAGVTFEEGKTEEYEYIGFSDGSLYITKYIGSAEAVIIPSVIEGKTVTSIEDQAFYGCSSLTC